MTIIPATGHALAGPEEEPVAQLAALAQDPDRLVAERRHCLGVEVPCAAVGGDDPRERRDVVGGIAEVEGRPRQRRVARLHAQLFGRHGERCRAAGPERELPARHDHAVRPAHVHRGVDLPADDELVDLVVVAEHRGAPEPQLREVVGDPVERAGAGARDPPVDVEQDRHPVRHGVAGDAQADPVPAAGDRR
jgi:hypothetical protein